MQRSPEEQALHRSREAAEAHKEVLLQASKAAEQLVVRMDKVSELPRHLRLQTLIGCASEAQSTLREVARLWAMNRCNSHRSKAAKYS